MVRIGSFHNCLTITVCDDLCLQYIDDALIDQRISSDDVMSTLRYVFRGAMPVLDALQRRDVPTVKKLVHAFDDCPQVGKFKVKRTPLAGELERLWGNNPGSFPRLDM